MNYATRHLYIPTLIGVALACMVIGLYTFNAIYLRDSNEYNFMKAELVNSCVIAPNRYFSLCDRYANWVLEIVPPYILHNCYDRMELRNRKTHSSISICASTFKVSFANFATDREVYCDKNKYC